MKLVGFFIENFRGYKSKTSIKFDDLTTFVGRNDIGKSTVLEALDVFFNDGKGLIKLTKDDINIEQFKNGKTDIILTGVFSDIPPKVVIDATNETTLGNEFLLNRDQCLEITKCFKNAQTTAAAIKVSIKAIHPSNENCCDLLSKKQSDLKKQIESLDIDCDKTRNAIMRSAIWNYYKEDLGLMEQDIDVSGSKGDDLKSIWTNLQMYLPYYSLFQSDRKNSDNDNEVQDPLKEAVKQIMSDATLQRELDDVATKVKEKLQEVSDLTLQKIKEMNPDIANSLHPRIPESKDLKWSDVFKSLSISGDEDIPINKRGSGVKRLILLNFFRAEAERRKKESNLSSIIYAIEEPETSQHKEHQIMLIKALKDLAKEEKTQVVLTTHSSEIVKNLQACNLRLLIKGASQTEVKVVERGCLPYPSLNEANYIAMGDVSEEYHNELYGYLQSKAVDENPDNEKEKDFDNWLFNNGCIKKLQWRRVKNGVVQSPYDVTLHTYIRNFIHHPENTHNNKYSDAELKESIDKMMDICKNII